MFSLLLKYILKKKLTMAVSWGLLYPTLMGNVVVNDVVIGPKPGVATAESITINPEWKTSLDDVITIESAKIKNLKGQIDLNDPLRALGCLRNRNCIMGRKGDEQVVPEVKTDSEKKKDSRDPLKLYVKKYEIQSGELLFKRGEQALIVKNLFVSGAEANLPFESEKVGFSMKGLVVRKGQEGSYEFTAKGQWVKSTQVFHLDFDFEKLPLEYITFIKGEQSVVMTGMLSGAVALEYNGETNNWVMK